MAPRPWQETDVPLIDPNVKNLVAEVSLATPTLYTSHKPARLNSAGKRTRILAIDCGIKANIIRYFMTCGVELLVSKSHHRGHIHHHSSPKPLAHSRFRPCARLLSPLSLPDCGAFQVVPWNHDISMETYDGLFISNGPGDPTM